MLKAEVARVKEAIKEAVFTNTVAGGIEEYIHKQNSALINLRFLEKNYLNYIDKNIQIPFQSALLKIYNTKEKLEFVKTTLLNSRLNPAYTHALSQPCTRGYS